MRITVEHLINEDLCLGWNVTLSQTFKAGKTNYLHISTHPLDTKPTNRQMRKFKREFREDAFNIECRQKEQREWEDCIIDRLGWDVE